MNEETYAWYMVRVLEEKNRIKKSSDLTKDEKKMYIRGLMFLETLHHEYLHSED